jgi:anti-sigma factor RsiW
MKYDCHDLEPLLEAYLDRELPGEAAVAVTEHLGRCPACSREVESERLLRESLSTLPQFALSATVSQRLVAATDHPAVEPVRGERLRPIERARGWIWRWGFAPVVVAALALLLLNVSERDRQTSGLDSPYSREEILTARQKARYCLALTLRIVNQSEKEAVTEVLGRQLPRTIYETIQRVVTTPEGGRG